MQPDYENLELYALDEEMDYVPEDETPVDGRQPGGCSSAFMTLIIVIVIALAGMSR